MSRLTVVYRPNDPRANPNGMVEKHLATPLVTADQAPMVIGDLRAYRSAAADVDGKRIIVGGRRQHREFLQRNGYREIGNDYVPPRHEEMPQADRIADIKRAMGV